MKFSAAPKALAFSLVELLCVVMVTGTLAGLLMTGVMAAYGRVKRMQREFEGPSLVEHFRVRLSEFCESQRSYPALSARQLHELGVFDGQIMALLGWRGVDFYPFSSSDPTNMIVLQVRYSAASMERVFKADLRR